LRPESILDRACEEKTKIILEHYRRIAIEHLKAGWVYTNSVPRSCVRIRLACAWPVLIGKQTLDRLAGESPSIAQPPVKIPRRAVRKILLKSIVAYSWPKLWEAQWQEKG
jgi:farnesyl-diphosphate farnesyltransferase